MIGLFVLVVCAALVVTQGGKDNFSDTVASTFAIGVGFLLLAELVPYVTAFKFGGVELEFGKAVSEKLSEIESRIAKLEVGEASKTNPVKGADGEISVVGAQSTSREAPGLQKEPKYPDDRHKGRFGRKTRSGEFAISASFKQLSADFVEAYLVVECRDEKKLHANLFAEFYLHETCRPDHQVRLFKHGIAELSLIIYGGFTVGVWIPAEEVELELDLATVRGAPSIIRER
jgi:hypothetical protein